MRKFKINAEMIASAALTALGIWVITISIGYGVWAVNKPAKGFMPLLAAGLMTFCSLIWFIQACRMAINEGAESGGKKSKVAKFTKNEAKWIAIVTLLCICTIFLMQWLGMYISLVIFLLVWLKFINRFSWSRTVLISAVITASLYLVFSVGLRIPFPKMPGLFI